MNDKIYTDLLYYYVLVDCRYMNYYWKYTVYSHKVTVQYAVFEVGCNAKVHGGNAKGCAKTRLRAVHTVCGKVNLA
jgi:hypothetical protein